MGSNYWFRLRIAAPGSPKWNAVRDELVALDFTIDPTFTIYEASRDLMRAMNADWQQDYAHPNLWSFFQPSRQAHGSYWFDWTNWFYWNNRMDRYNWCNWMDRFYWPNWTNWNIFWDRIFWTRFPKCSDNNA